MDKYKVKDRGSRKQYTKIGWSGAATSIQILQDKYELRMGP